MEPLNILPAASGVDVHRCLRCGNHRICRGRWRTRCHICLDERSLGLAISVGQGLLSRLPDEPELAHKLRQFAGLATVDVVTPRIAAEFQAAVALAADLDRRSRVGWTDVSGDVYGLPWYGRREQYTSHGTWGVHIRCGSWHRLTDHRSRCRVCPPEAGDRTFIALRDTPYLLYLVRHRGLLKFGVGGVPRVREHLRAGAELVEVLEARHADVIDAEVILKRRKREAAVPLRVWRKWRMPSSFGKGTEVVYAAARIRLADVLPNGVDVRDRFVC
ncbi:hypothetical protein ACTFTM_19170 [Micromonospora sp. RB23]